MSKTIEVTSPFDGKVVGTVPFRSVEEVQAAIDLASDTFLDHKNALPAYKRVEILEKVAEIMSSQVEELTILCASEGGKPYVILKLKFKEQSTVLNLLLKP
jgi:acyl-CoA reductase-like NAD-dependent aldehyde dehydrogenase